MLAAKLFPAVLLDREPPLRSVQPFDFSLRQRRIDTGPVCPLQKLVCGACMLLIKTMLEGLLKASASIWEVYPERENS